MCLIPHVNMWCVRECVVTVVVFEQQATSLLVDRVFDTFFFFVILLEWLVFLFVSAVGDLFCFRFLMTSAHTQMIFYLFSFLFDLLLLLFVLLELCSVHFFFFFVCVFSCSPFLLFAKRANHEEKPLTSSLNKEMRLSLCAQCRFFSPYLERLSFVLTEDGSGVTLRLLSKKKKR